MSDFEFIKIVPLEVHGPNGGYNLRPYELGHWRYAKRHVWGLTYDNRITQMAYALEYHKTFARGPAGFPRTAYVPEYHKTFEESFNRRRNKFKETAHADWLRWYFDVGRGIYSTLDDLEVALKKLNIWEQNPDV